MKEQDIDREAEMPPLPDWSCCTEEVRDRDRDREKEKEFKKPSKKAQSGQVKWWKSQLTCKAAIELDKGGRQAYPGHQDHLVT